MTTDTADTVILIVDDDDLVLKTLNVLITSLGYSCLLASDGLEAVEILREKQCELILCDVLMPNMGGLELLAYVREKYPKIDVIVATGFSEQATYADVIKAGAIDFIKKPIDQAELEAKLARAMRERRMVRELEQLSLSDTLTSVYNRRAFDQKFADEVERAYRQDYSLFLAIVDIDNFKEYNDKFGHAEGDTILISLGDILEECTRNNVDMAFRLGGDEFAVILPQTSADQATEIVQRILLRYIESNYGKTTLSIGIVSCDRDSELELEEDIRRMKERADKAMYEAKNGGKNCVICRL
ncbi:MAG TPA: diguanylate cyclase [Desulfopila sp.]|nr:diguanylate cyclase [Desulfopila sp.]